MDIHKKLKKLMVIGMMVMMVCVLTGCDIPGDLANSLQQSFSDRAEANKNIANRLYGSGLIREDTFNKLVEDIDGKLGHITDNMSEDNKAMENMLKACVGWHVPEEEDHEVYNAQGDFVRWFHGGNTKAHDVFDAGATKCTHNHHAQCSTFTQQFITSYMAQFKETVLFVFTVADGSEVSGNHVPACGGNSGTIKPIEVISESMVEELNEQLSVPIYVLKTGVTDSTGQGLDGIMEAINRADTSTNVTEAEQILANYFEEATYIDKDGNENTLTILDPAVPEQQIVRVTSRTYEEAEDPDFDPFTFDGVEVDVTCNHWQAWDDNFSPDGNEPGLDATIWMGGHKVLSVRLVEFNKKAVEELDARIGLGNNRYLVLNGRAYLMEYPLGYIDGFVETEDRTGYKSIIKQSQLGFNLLTGEFSKFTLDEDGEITNKSVPISKNDPYLTYMGAASQADESMSSLIMYGETGVSEDYGGEEIDDELELLCNEPWDLVMGGSDSDPYVVSIGRIVLRDYLEATYAPGVVNNESLVVMGRKLRVLQLDGSKDNPVARFYDKDGAPLPEPAVNLYIEDFADIDEILNASPKVKYISHNKEEVGSGTSGTGASSETGVTPGEEYGEEGLIYGDEEGETTGTSEAEQLITSSTSKIDQIPTEIVSEIHCTTKFPSKLIGSLDEPSIETDDKQLFYTMLVRRNIFETGLFSGWIQSTDQSKNSTTWWNNWLSTHGYQYYINIDNLVDFLKGNYKYELNKSGVIILDLETIAKIQAEFDQEDKEDTGHWLRTVFIIFGYILIAYSIVILIAWNVDVNVDLGINILEKISFGRWIAVKDYEEMPMFNEDEISFVRFGELLPKCIIIIALGIGLILVNIVDVILMMIQLFGGLADYLARIFTGVM